MGYPATRRMSPPGQVKASPSCDQYRAGRSGLPWLRSQVPIPSTPDPAGSDVARRGRGERRECTGREARRTRRSPAVGRAGRRNPAGRRRARPPARANGMHLRHAEGAGTRSPGGRCSGTPLHAARRAGPRNNLVVVAGGHGRDQVRDLPRPALAAELKPRNRWMAIQYEQRGHRPTRVACADGLGAGPNMAGPVVITYGDVPLLDLRDPARPPADRAHAVSGKLGHRADRRARTTPRATARIPAGRLGPRQPGPTRTARAQPRSSSRQDASPAQLGRPGGQLRGCTFFEAGRSCAPG